MSGVIVAMRRSLLSCTSLARHGLISLGSTLGSTVPALAGDLRLLDTISALSDLNRQEIAVLATALALLGFSVVAAILLMRSRLRAARNEARLRADIQDLQFQPQRILAFGTWLPPEPALQMDHAVDALRESGQAFVLNLTTSSGYSVEAMGRAIGGQAIVRIRELSGLRLELAETHLRYKALSEETEMLRGFAAAVPWPIWAKSAGGGLSFANAAYAR